MAATIGIKIANGEFYSIVDENSSIKKRLILTTVHDKQRSVQIDLYKSETKTMADAMYIGSLVVANIKPRLKGEPSIELVINSTTDGTINADAWDMDPSGKKEHQYLNVSLKTLEDENRNVEISDYEIEDSERPPNGLYEKAEAVRQLKKKNLMPIIIIAAMVLIILCLGLWLLLARGKTSGGQSQTLPPAASSTPQAAAPQAQSSPPAQPPASSTQPAQAAAAEQPVQPAPTPAPPATPPAPATPAVIEAPAVAPQPVQVDRTRPVPPVRTYRVPTTIPPEGVRYTIRWGDTLWDIAEAFYRNPWLYPRIARFNNIRNPDLIISGTTIRVPPRN